MSIRQFLLYFAAWCLVSLTPGPTVLCCVAQATRFGFRSSLSGIFGVQAASFLLFVCIALGLDSLLAASKIAFNAMRIVGAFYLSYFGVRLTLSTFQPTALPAIQSPIALTAKHGLFVQGLLVQLTNPKALLFVSAWLPQFIDPHRSVPLQIAILTSITILVDSVVLSAYAFLAQRSMKSIRANWWSILLKRFLGAALLCFGLSLLFSVK